MEEAVVNTVDKISQENWLITSYGVHYVRYAIVLWFLAGGVAIGFIAIFLAKWFAPSDPSPAKRSTYECSEQPFGSAWIKFNIRYYYIALLFLIFDVEVVFFYPWAVVFRTLKEPHFGEFGEWITLGFPIFGEMLVFLFLLVLGWLYAWRKGYLTWD